ncbi:MAG: hypothetical protein GY829_11245 [Gammaproteobacteria bacterium]|nr:hypothetical protein [Gammaproteobacteria bacterium]
MYNKPQIWDNVSIFEETEIALDKLLENSTLVDRERFVLSELTRGLLDVVETTIDRTIDESEKEALLDTIVGVLQFLEFLDGTQTST